MGAWVHGCLDGFMNACKFMDGLTRRCRVRERGSLHDDTRLQSFSSTFMRVIKSHNGTGAGLPTELNANNDVDMTQEVEV